MREWQPIETAPTDAGQIIGWFPLPARKPESCVHKMHWDDERYVKKPRPHWAVFGWMWGKATLRECQPTHWMPLPDPPSSRERGDA